MTLSEFLNDISVFEVLESTTTSSGTEICLGRVSRDDVWFNMFGAALMAQQKRGLDFLSVSKQYLIQGEDLGFLWKVTSKDVKMLEDFMPRIDKTLDEQRKYKPNVQGGTLVDEEGEADIPLMGMRDMKLPQPEDFGFRSDSKDFSGKV